MKTIFDYNPTSAELNEIGFYSFVTAGALGVSERMTKAVYIEHVPEDQALFDIALLLEARGLSATEIWAQIPDLYDEYVRGFDYIESPA